MFSPVVVLRLSCGCIVLWFSCLVFSFVVMPYFVIRSATSPHIMFSEALGAIGLGAFMAYDPKMPLGDNIIQYNLRSVLLSNALFFSCPVLSILPPLSPCVVSGRVVSCHVSCLVLVVFCLVLSCLMVGLSCLVLSCGCFVLSFLVVIFSCLVVVLCLSSLVVCLVLVVLFCGCLAVVLSCGCLVIVLWFSCFVVVFVEL